jgi:hypothetical protein
MIYYFKFAIRGELLQESVKIGDKKDVRFEVAYTGGQVWC